MIYLIGNTLKSGEFKSPFADLHTHLSNLMDQLSQSYSAFSIYDSLKEERAPNKCGQIKAYENTKTMNNYNHFFGPVEWAVLVNTILTLAKFFDRNPHSLSIYKIIDFIEANRSKLTVKDFKEYFKDRERVEILARDYKCLTKEDLKNIEEKIQENKNLINKIKTLRDKYFAHNDIKKIEVDITPKEILEIFKIIEEIMQKVCLVQLDETWSFEPLKEMCKQHTSNLIDDLKSYKVLSK